MSLPVVDLFSCGGGMSAGFAGAFDYRLRAAVDLQVAKPSDRNASGTGCNRVYAANHGVVPLDRDLFELSPTELMAHAGLGTGDAAVLIACSPCTDFTRAKPRNHFENGRRNSLVGRSADFVEAMRPTAFAMENARELVAGRHPKHWDDLRGRLEAAGYAVRADVHLLTRFGLPQSRERALVLAVRGRTVRGLDELWEGWAVAPGALTVRHAFRRLEEWRSRPGCMVEADTHTSMGDAVRQRIEATPADGGGWVQIGRSGRFDLMTPDCIRRFRAGVLNSHPDVYGRMWWDRPAPTLKRECAHPGNGRYLHPAENRLVTVAEAAALQGFPFGYRFGSAALKNRYRMIGDAVPPLVARQVAACLRWSVTGLRPSPEEWVLPNGVLQVSDLVRTSGRPVAGFELAA